MSDTDTSAEAFAYKGEAMTVDLLRDLLAERDDYEARTERAEAKLAKTVDALQEAIRLANQPYYGNQYDALYNCFNAIDVLRTTLAELKGQTDE